MYPGGPGILGVTDIHCNGNSRRTPSHARSRCFVKIRCSAGIQRTSRCQKQQGLVVSHSLRRKPLKRLFIFFFVPYRSNLAQVAELNDFRAFSILTVFIPTPLHLFCLFVDTVWSTKDKSTSETAPVRVCESNIFFFSWCFYFSSSLIQATQGALQETYIIGSQLKHSPSSKQQPHSPNVLISGRDVCVFSVQFPIIIATGLKWSTSFLLVFPTFVTKLQICILIDDNWFWNCSFLYPFLQHRLNAECVGLNISFFSKWPSAHTAKGKGKLGIIFRIFRKPF